MIETTEISYFYHYALDSLGKQDYRDNYKKCEWGGVCLQLRDGKLFPCARIAYIEKVNKAFGVDFQYDKNDFIEINKLNRWNFYNSYLVLKNFVVIVIGKQGIWKNGATQIRIEMSGFELKQVRYR